MDMFKFKRKVIETEPMSQFVEKELMPGSSVSTDEEIEGERWPAGDTSMASNTLPEHARKVVGTCWRECQERPLLYLS